MCSYARGEQNQSTRFNLVGPVIESGFGIGSVSDGLQGVLRIPQNLAMIVG